MPSTLSLDFKSSALLIALVLVPIVILFCTVAIALACSEFWSCHPHGPSWFSRLCRRKKKETKERQTWFDPDDSSTPRATESSDIPLEYERPVIGLEHV